MRPSNEPHPPLLQRLLDAWFSPKRFESETLYEPLGVLFIKRYVPTGGDFFIRRYGIRIAHIRGSLESLNHFERYTRRLEAIHEIAFLGFMIFSLRRAILSSDNTARFWVRRSGLRSTDPVAGELLFRL
jgi:hypothetical protein